jgi:hypothetical protein
MVAIAKQVLPGVRTRSPPRLNARRGGVWSPAAARFAKLEHDEAGKRARRPNRAYPSLAFL